MGKSIKTGVNTFIPSMGTFEHIHQFQGITSFSDRHEHELYGCTVKTVKNGTGHYHIFEGTTSFDDNHVHNITVCTGNMVFSNTKSHTHVVEGKTTVSNKHYHNFSIQSGDISKKFKFN